jgi:hypothetical protein
MRYGSLTGTAAAMMLVVKVRAECPPISVPLVPVTLVLFICPTTFRLHAVSATTAIVAGDATYYAIPYGQADTLRKLF